MTYNPTSITDNPIYATHGVTPNSFKYFRAALARARAGTGDVRIACEGDSICNGGNATTPLTENFTRRAAYTLAQKTGLGVRQGMIPVKYFGSVMAQWTVGADWTQWGNMLDQTGQAYQATTGTSTTLDFAPTDDAGSSIPCDSFIIYAWGGSGATPPQWAVDAGTYTALTSTGISSTFGNSGPQRYVVSAGTRGTHTLHLKAAASGSATIVLGAEAVDSQSRGIRYIMGGSSGSVTPVPSYNAMAPHVAFQPDLMMYEWNTNDYGTQVALATFQSRVQAVMALPGASFTQKADCLWLAAPPQGIAPLTIPQSAYYAALDAAGDAVGVPVHHLDRILVSYAVSNAAPISAYGDTIHPNTVGHNLWGASIGSLLALL